MQEQVFKCTLKSLFILAKGHTEERGRKKKEEEERKTKQHIVDLNHEILMGKLQLLRASGNFTLHKLGNFKCKLHQPPDQSQAAKSLRQSHG